MVGLNSSGSVSSYPETKHELYGSGLFMKKEIRSENDEKGPYRNSKVVKTDEEEPSDCNHSMSQLRSISSSLFFSNEFHQQQNQMLSFNCSKLTSQSAALPCFQPAAGYRGNNSKGECNGFTASQWMELEQQALIYKYIRANMPIPSHLLLPIRKAFESVALSGLSAGVLRPSNTLGWGAFHLGFSTSTDPEPGRCRRTDGKKWRCSRDAVADQKYCERHINRGRHRSRKPVEGQQRQVRSHSSSAAAKTANTTSTLAAVNNSIASSQPTSLNRMCLNKDQSEELHDPTSFTKLSSTSMYWQKPEGNPMLNAEERCPFEETSHNKFGFVSSETSNSLSQNNPSPFMCLANQETGQIHHPFMQSWSMNQTDMTHMSLSSDFLSPISTNSEKVSILPLALSHEPDFLQMGFGVGDDSSIDWENSIGGPLGEALQDSQTSPRCVLQKTTFPNVSYSSAGSSPGATNPVLVHEGLSFELNIASHSSSLPD